MFESHWVHIKTSSVINKKHVKQYVMVLANTTMKRVSIVSWRFIQILQTYFKYFESSSIWGRIFLWKNDKFQLISKCLKHQYARAQYCNIHYNITIGLVNLSSDNSKIKSRVNIAGFVRLLVTTCKIISTDPFIPCKTLTGKNSLV